MRQLLTGRQSLRHRWGAAFLGPVVIALMACAGESADTPPDAGATAASDEGPATSPAVSIDSPAEGTTVASGPMMVNLSVTGLTITVAGDTTSGTGHHHLFLDRDVTPAGQAMPAEPGFIVHMGDGSTSYTFESIAPGEHRLIAVVGDGLHIPLQPWVTDTVRFSVR